MRIEHSHCFLVVHPENQDEVKLMEEFTGRHLVIQKKVYERRNNTGKVRIQYINLFTKSKEQLPKFTIWDGFLIRLSRFLERKNIPYTYSRDRERNLQPDWENVERLFTFRTFQKECLTAVNAMLSKGFGGVVVAPPAFGKSHLIAMLVNLYKSHKIDVISRRRDVVLSTYSAILRTTPDVGLVTSGRCQLDNRITVFTADSLTKSHFDAELVILDEVHELVIDRYTKLLSCYYAPKLGLTATPDTRYDNLHHRIESICGPRIYEISYQAAEQASLVVPILVLWYKVEAPRSAYPDPVSRKRYGIWGNSTRNLLIAEIARQHYNLDRQVLILVETIEHALNLKKVLPEFEVCYAGSRKELTGTSEVPEGFYEMNSKKRQELYDKFKSRKLKGVIATGVWSVGVSFDSLEVLIRAEGSGSKTAATQAPGRVCRISNEINKNVGLVIDFIDTFERGLIQKSIERYKCYEKHGWQQYDAQHNIPLTLDRLKRLGYLKR